MHLPSRIIIRENDRLQALRLADQYHYNGNGEVYLHINSVIKLNNYLPFLVDHIQINTQESRVDYIFDA